MTYQIVTLFLCSLLILGTHQLDLADEKLSHAHHHCQNDVKTQITDSMAHQLHSGDFVNDPQVKAHLLCFSKNVGIQSETGELQTEAINEAVTKLKSADFANDLAAKCLKTKSTPEETAYNLFKCWRENNFQLKHGGESHHHHH